MRWMALTALLWVAALMSPAPVGALEARTTTWPDGRPRIEGTYLRDMRHGEFRTWHENGQLAELRHYFHGREAGHQQAWTKDGVMFLNYEVRDGRRYGLVNSKPCLPAEGGAEKGAM